MRGKYYHTYGYGNQRDYPLADDKYAIEQLAERYSFINGEKVGILVIPEVDLCRRRLY